MQNIVGEDVYQTVIWKIVKRKCGVWYVFRTNGTGTNSLLLLYVVSECNKNLFINTL